MTRAYEQQTSQQCQHLCSQPQSRKVFNPYLHSTPRALDPLDAPTTLALQATFPCLPNIVTFVRYTTLAEL